MWAEAYAGGRDGGDKKKKENNNRHEEVARACAFTRVSSERCSFAKLVRGHFG